jgi:hypothetical protein
VADIAFRDNGGFPKYRKAKYTGELNDGYVGISAPEGCEYISKHVTSVVDEAEEIAIPTGSTCVQFSCLSSYTKFYIAFNETASESSALYYTDNSIIPLIQLGSTVTKLSIHVVSGKVGSIFFGN